MSYDIAHTQNLKNGTNEPIYKTNRLTDVENKLMVIKVRISWEIGIDIYTLLYITQVTNKNLLYSTRNSTQYSVMNYMGIESKKEWKYVYV